MADNTITFILDGEIPLVSFADECKSFSALIAALSVEEKATSVEWIIDDLAPSSGRVTIRGQSVTPDPVERVVRAYESVGRSLQHGDRILRPPSVVRPAMAIAKRLGGPVKAIRFETAENEAVISVRPSRRRAQEQLALAAPEARVSTQIPGAYGAIEGIVETLARRHGLRFTLYDSLNDRAVSCYLQPNSEETMRDVWGKRAIVQGWVTRDPADGHPLAIRHIDDVTPILAEGDYRKARAILPLKPGELSPEEQIRRLRDA